MDPRVVKYDQLMIGTITIYPNNNFSIPSKIFRIGSKNTMGKWAVFGNATPKITISSKCAYREQYVCPGNNIYVSSSSKLSRNVLRNSQYKIKMDPENAVATIIPAPQSDDCYLKYNFAFIRTDLNHLYLINIEETYYTETHDIPDDVINKIKEEFENRFGKETIEWIDVRKQNPGTIALIEKVEEYDDIICDRYPDRRYVFDTKLHIIPATEICVDTLQIWKSMERSLIPPCIESSDWQKYPVTICAFIAAYFPHIIITASPQFKRILNEIKYRDYINQKYDNITITPEDLDMLSKWITSQLGTDEHGGFIESDKTIDPSLRKFYKKRVAIKPLTIDAPVCLDNIIQFSKA